MIARLSARDPDWLAQTLAALRHLGAAVVEEVVPDDLLAAVGAAQLRLQELLPREIGAERLRRSGEMGVQRIPMRTEPVFLRLLELPEVLQVVGATVSETAILHVQNGLVLPPAGAAAAGAHFQTSFHRDFPRCLNGYLCSVNTLLAIDEFTDRNGGTLVVPGTHQRAEPPDARFLRDAAVALRCPAGSMLVFDSTLWHAAGENRSDRDRRAVNQQFTRSYFKQQIDYVRALGDEVVLAQPPRTQQLLGWYTRVVTSLDEYYRAPAERLYRAGQG
jgi:ectoine hydroxylase-related dioxygenase (phytanoyl-CoA dioxygenase family)